MKRVLLALTALVGFGVVMPHLANSQIINTEVKRINTGQDTALATLFGGYNFTRSIFRATSARANAQGYLVRNGRIWMVLADYQLNTFNEVRNVFNQLVHVRFTKDFGRFSESGKYQGGGFLLPEVFQQVQVNQVQLIDVRWLSGIGTRLRLLEKDSLQLYGGVVGMFEYENTNGEGFSEQNRDVRLSNYISFGAWLSPYIELRNTTYYQPRVDAFEDFRISTETNLRVVINEWLSLNASYNLAYDTNPPRQLEEGLEQTLEDTFIFIVTGLEVSF